MTTTARIIDDGPHSAAFNMAADLHLLALCEQAPAVYVRFYSWEKPSVTLGMAEKPHDTLDEEAMMSAGAQWIRRPTGGRSVLHHGDITYACMFTNGIDGLGVTLMETYRIISNCLAAGLALAGIRCEAHDASLDDHLKKTTVRLPCFLSPNRHEIMVNGKKLVGSAQKRTSGAVLQHGSIPITPAFRTLPDFLRISNADRRTQKEMLAAKCICLREICPDLDETTFRESMIHGFETSLPFEFTRAPWSAHEKRTIDEIAKSAEFNRRWHE
jgi:lipoate-protein ligase A